MVRQAPVNPDLGEGVAVHIDEDKLDESEEVITEKLDMLVYISGEYWNVGKRLAKFRFSMKNKKK